MKISHKLILVIVINLVAVMGLGTVSYLNIRTINAEFDELVQFPIPSILRLSNMTESLILSIEEAHSYRLYGLPDDKEQYYKSSAEFNRLLEELKKELHYGTPEIPPEDIPLIDAISTETNLLNQAIIADFAKYENGLGVETGIDPFSAQKERIVGLLGRYRDMEKEEIVAAHDQVNRTTDEAIVMILGSVLIILILNLVINGLIAKSIIAPLRLLWETSRELGVGNFSKRVEISNKDEFGTLAAAFNIMADNIQKSHSDLQTRIEQSTEELKKAKKELDEATAKHVAEMATPAPKSTPAETIPPTKPQIAESDLTQLLRAQ